jgi:phosphoenolpyruvate carboxylase
MQQQQLQQLQQLQQQQQQQKQQQINVKDTLSAYTANEQLVFDFIKNIILNLILTIKPLRVKMRSILNQPDVIYVEVLKVYEENKTKFTPTDIENIKTIVSVTNSVTELNGIFLDAFTKIMEDGKIDMNDSIHFMTFMHEVVRLFNDYTTNQNFKISLSSESVLYFLHFIIKSILILTLDDEQEPVAILMLDASIKLIQIAVLPITKCKCNRGCFSFNH